MKFLCLHGYGTSGYILEQQLIPIANALGGNHEFVYLDGDVKVDKTVLSGMFPPPYLAYQTFPESAQVAHTFTLIDAALDDAEDASAPFDAILGFSQGGASAMSYLIHHAKEFPNEPSPFRFAVLFSPTMPVSPDGSYQEEAIRSFLDKLSPEEVQKFHDTWSNEVEVMDVRSFASYSKFTERDRVLSVDLFESMRDLQGTNTFLHNTDYKLYDQITDFNFPRFFHPTYTPQRLQIPTVHVAGKLDTGDFQRMKVKVKDLCAPDKVEVLTHEGAHEIPRDAKNAEAIARAIERANYFGQI